MLSVDQVAALLRSAEYFASRPSARIGRDRERRRVMERLKKRRQRAKRERDRATW